MMSKKQVRPCIRGLKHFQKTGCPRRPFDPVTGEGCDAWATRDAPSEDRKKMVLKSACIDNLMEFWAYEALKLQEGNQQATESLRNGMCEVGQDGQVYPKMDRAILGLVSLLQREKEDRRLLSNSKN